MCDFILKIAKNVIKILFTPVFVIFIIQSKG